MILFSAWKLAPRANQRCECSSSCVLGECMDQQRLCKRMWCEQLLPHSCYPAECTLIVPPIQTFLPPIWTHWHPTHQSLDKSWPPFALSPLPVALYMLRHTHTQKEPLQHKQVRATAITLSHLLCMWDLTDCLTVRSRESKSAVCQDHNDSFGIQSLQSQRCWGDWTRIWTPQNICYVGARI